MIRFLFVLMIQLITGSALLIAQDTLHLVNDCKVLINSLDTNSNVVKYNLFPNNKQKEINKSQLVSVNYKNGRTHIFNTFDTLVLINGRNVLAKSVTTGTSSISYRTPANKIKSINSGNVFSIRQRDGKESVIYEKDKTDSLEFSVEQMRLFIRGEQDAAKYYKDNVVKVSAFLIGGAGALLGWGGVAIPPVYSTILGAFSPDMSKQIVSDLSLVGKIGYDEGYEKKARERKIRNSIISGLAGLVTGAVTYSFIFKK